MQGKEIIKQPTIQNVFFYLLECVTKLITFETIASLLLIIPPAQENDIKENDGRIEDTWNGRRLLLKNRWIEFLILRRYYFLKKSFLHFCFSNSFLFCN